MSLEPGLDILNTGKGHAEISYNNGDPIEIARAQRIIEDMLKRGYMLFIQKQDGEIIKVERFDAKAGKYIIGDGALYPGSEPIGPEEGVITDHEKEVSPALRRGRPRKASVEVAKVRTVAIGRSSGG